MCALWMKKFINHGNCMLSHLSAADTSPSCDVPPCTADSQDDIGDGTLYNVQTCIEIVRQLLYQAVVVLSSNKFTVHKVLLHDITNNDLESSLDSVLNDLISRDSCTREISSFLASHVDRQLSGETNIESADHENAAVKRKRGRPKKLLNNDRVSSVKVCDDEGNAPLLLRKSQRHSTAAVGMQHGEKLQLSDSEKRTKNTSVLTRDHCLVFKKPTCCLCGTTFTETSDCIAHWRQFHIVCKDKHAQVACTHCSLFFSFPASRIASDLHVEVQMARWFNHVVRCHDVAVPVDCVQQFTCTQANCSFISVIPAVFETHRRRSHHGVGRGVSGGSSVVFLEHRCFLCEPSAESNVYSSKTALVDHIRQRHVVNAVDGPVIVCPVCRQERPLIQCNAPSVQVRERHLCFAIYRLLHHLIIKHEWSIPQYVRSYSCQHPGCSYVAVAKADVQRHAASHDSCVGSSRSPCEKCGKLVKSRAMRSHIRICQVSLDERRVLSCPRCPVRVTSQYSLRYHLKAVHSEGIKDFLCAYCTFSCRIKSNFEEHVYHRHNVNISCRPVVSCDRCKFTTIKPATLRRHNNVVHSSNKDHVCQVCSKTFKCQLHLRSHMVSHEERRFLCSMCPYKAARKANLMSHISAQHSGNRHQFQCVEACGYSTGYAANLSKHRKLFCKFRHLSSDASTCDTNRLGHDSKESKRPVSAEVFDATLSGTETQLLLHIDGNPWSSDASRILNCRGDATNSLISGIEGSAIATGAFSANDIFVQHKL